MKDLREKSRLLDRLWYRLPKPRGRLGIRLLGYSGYVGGLWDDVGFAQLEFLCSRGLQPHHYLLDIGCGSLRGGVRFIRHLDAGHYMGVDQERLLMDLGVEKELGVELFEERRPQLIETGRFDFDALRHPPDFAVAFSLFSHLPDGMIEDCLKKLKRVIRDDGVFFASFIETKRPQKNPKKPHPHRGFRYTIEEMLEFGERTGWRGEPDLHLQHGIKQRMLKYLPS